MDNHIFEDKQLNIEGPDQLAPAQDVKTWTAHQGVLLRMEKEGAAALSPVSIISAFKDTVEKFSCQTALMYKENNIWKKITYAQYYETVQTVSKAYIHLGLEKHMSVGIIGFNSAEWFISDLAAIFAGGIACGIYTTNSAEACQYIAINARCQILVVENDSQLQKFVNQMSKLPLVKAIIQYKGALSQKYEGVYTWAEMLEMGTSNYNDQLEQRIKSIAPNNCSTLIYTSGTTGEPKGVMLSHDNFIWTANSLLKDTNLPAGHRDVIVSYLPLSHVAAHLVDIYVSLVQGGTIAFAQPDALKGSLSATLKEIRPTVFVGVPRVWEKIKEAMIEIGSKKNFIEKTFFNWAKDIGYTGNINVMNGGSRPLIFNLADKLVFSKVKQQLGMDRARLMVSGAAPNTRETINFFLSLNLPIMDVFGMSETTGPHCIGNPNCFRIYSSGKEFPGVRTLFHSPTSDGEGEICMSGRHVFMGYLNDEKKTKEAIDPDGWLHSGDLAKMDEDGFITITGRIKELIITAGGENVPPVPIEEKVKEALPCVSNCMLIGDKRKFLSMLIALKTVIDPDTQEPKDNLTSACADWFRSKGANVKFVSEIITQRYPVVMKAIQDGIDVVNKNATSRAQCIQKWTILPRDFSIAGGELGPTLKLKRPTVLQMHNETINSFYLNDNS